MAQMQLVMAYLALAILDQERHNLANQIVWLEARQRDSPEADLIEPLLKRTAKMRALKH